MLLIICRFINNNVCISFLHVKIGLIKCYENILTTIYEALKYYGESIILLQLENNTAPLISFHPPVGVQMEDDNLLLPLAIPSAQVVEVCVVAFSCLLVTHLGVSKMMLHNEFSGGFSSLIFF